MTLFKSAPVGLSLARLSAKLLIATMMLAGTMAQATVILPGTVLPGSSSIGTVTPDRRPDRPRRPGDGRDDRGPIKPGPHDPGYDRPISQEIYIGRYLRNESVNLLREIDHLRGYRVEAVHVYIDRAREVNSSLDLMVNGRSEDSRRADVGRAVTLTPRSFLEIGRQLRDLDVYFRGEMLINRIVVEMSRESLNPPPYDDGREISVPLNLPSYLPPQPRLDLTPYIDIRRYQGYEVRGVEITAVARGGSASLEVLLNGFSEGNLFFTTRQSTQIIRSRQNLVIGNSFGNLILAPRGDSNIIQVRLILSRY